MDHHRLGDPGGASLSQDERPLRVDRQRLQSVLPNPVRAGTRLLDFRTAYHTILDMFSNT